VVFCSDDEGLRKKLEALAKKEKLKRIVLTIDNPRVPNGTTSPRTLTSRWCCTPSRMSRSTTPSRRTS
jgi:hypothetical protein